MEAKVLVVTILGLVLATSGCLSSLNETPSSNEANPGVENQSDQDEEERQEPTIAEPGTEIEITSFQDKSFDKERIEVSQGQTVKFTLINQGGTHDLAIPELGLSTSTLVGEGETASFTHTFEELGEYQFRCTVPGHEEAGMEGKVVVNP